MDNTASNVEKNASAAASGDHAQSEALDQTGGSDRKELSPQSSNSEQMSHIQRFLLLAPVTLTYFLWFLDLAVVSTATPAITTEFNSLADVGW